MAKATERDHIDRDGCFQSDKYDWSAPDFVPLKVSDPTAQPLLWEYANSRRPVDAAFADDLQHRLREVGYNPDVREGLPENSGKPVEWYPLADVVELLQSRTWNWLIAPTTKYLEIRIDTRDMCCLVFEGQLIPESHYERDEFVQRSPIRRLLAKDIDELRERFETLEARRTEFNRETPTNGESDAEVQEG